MPRAPRCAASRSTSRSRLDTGPVARGAASRSSTASTPTTSAGVLVPSTVPPYGSAPLAGGLDVRGRSLLRSPDEQRIRRHPLRAPARSRRPHSREHRLLVQGRLLLRFLGRRRRPSGCEQDAYGVLNARVAYASRGRRLGDRRLGRESHRRELLRRRRAHERVVARVVRGSAHVRNRFQASALIEPAGCAAFRRAAGRLDR